MGMAASTASPYQYRPLQHRQIRVLEIRKQKRLDGTHGITELYLRHVALNKKAKYEAISYTWDGQTCDVPIVCDGQTLLVTPNCIRLLARLARRKCNRFWIDAICIDQSSPNAAAEKAVQLPLMGEIYRHATCVIAWLGESSPETTQVFQYWKEIWAIVQPWLMEPNVRKDEENGIRKSPPPQIKQQIQHKRVQFNEANYRRYGRHPTDNATMLAEVFACRYFTRMWTLQEVVMGSEVLVLCGDDEIFWDCMARVMSFLIEIEKADNNIRKHESAIFNRIIPHSTLRTRIQPDIRAVGKFLHWPVAALLGMTIRFDTRDPRDKFYAIYGILSEMGLQTLPPVDYHKPVAQVYAKASEQALSRDPKLHLMCYLGGQHIVPGLPSWALDLSVDYRLPIIQGESANASGNSFPVIVPLGGRLLATRGKMVDSISRRATRTLPSDLGYAERGPNAPSTAPMSRLLAGISERIRAYLEWADMFFEVQRQLGWDKTLTRFRDVLTQGGFMDDPAQPRSPEGFPRDDLQYFERWVSYLLAYGGRLNEDIAAPVLQEMNSNAQLACALPDVQAMYFNSGIDRSVFIHNREWRVLMAWGNSPMRAVHALIHKMTMGHTFFITNDGRMGLGTEQLRDGDKIILFCGALTPMIVRLVEDDRLQVVGPAYIEGLMQGELWSTEDLQDVVLV